ncbi:hypothetical protein BHE74_00013665 [Ensete ventricosum]|nr:hypothetical protein BHE74_00013665 [Ensete ventricosum]
MESPSHPSFGRHSRSSSASRFSGPFLSSSGRKGYRKRVNDNGWPECNVIQEEGSYDDLDEDKGLSRRCQIILALLSFLLLFTVFSLIIWGTARPNSNLHPATWQHTPLNYSLDTRVCGWMTFYTGEGTDSTGVPTKMVTVNCSLKISVFNTAAMFGIHVTSSPINLMFSEITITTEEASLYLCFVDCAYCR